MPALSHTEFALRGFIILGILLVGGVVAALVFGLSQALLMLFGAILFALLLDGLGGVLRAHTPLGQMGSVLVSLLCILLLIAAGAFLVVVTMGDRFSGLVQSLPQTLQQVQLRLADTALMRAWSESLPSFGEMVSSSTSGRTLQLISTATKATVQSVANFAVVILIGFYLAMEPDLYAKNVLYLLPNGWQGRGGEVLAALGNALRRWLIGRIIAMTAIAALATGGLLIIGMPGAVALGVMTGLVCFVPYIGPWLAAIPPVLLALGLGSTQVASVLIVYAILQFIETNFITPLVQKKAVSLPPALLVTSQLVCYFIFGLLGIVLATPVMITLMILVQMLYVEDLLGHRVKVLGAPDAPKEGAELQPSPSPGA